MKNKLRVALIGLGYWGKILSKCIARNLDFELRYIADTRADVIGETGGCGLTSVEFVSTESLMKKNDVDAIFITTPAATHFDLTMACLIAGKHVWVEKPIAQKVMHVERLIKEAHDKRLVIFVDHTYLYDGAIKATKELIESGEIGRPLYYDSARTALGLFRQDASVIDDLAVHDFSILDFLIKEQPTSISAAGMAHFDGFPSNLANITVFYHSNFLAHISVSWISPIKNRKFFIGGEAKTIEYNDSRYRNKLILHDTNLLNAHNLKSSQFAKLNTTHVEKKLPPHDTEEPLSTALEHFLECIRKEEAPLTSGSQGLRMIKMLRAANSSLLQKGIPVDI